MRMANVAAASLCCRLKYFIDVISTMVQCSLGCSSAPQLLSCLNVECFIAGLLIFLSSSSHPAYGRLQRFKSSPSIAVLVVA